MYSKLLFRARCPALTARPPASIHLLRPHPPTGTNRKFRPLLFIATIIPAANFPPSDRDVISSPSVESAPPGTIFSSLS